LFVQTHLKPVCGKKRLISILLPSSKWPQPSMVGAIFLWGFCEARHTWLGHLGLNARPPGTFRWLGNEGAKMSNSRKSETDKLTTNENSREITADELNQVVGGTYTKQKPDGTAGGNVAGGWGLIANKVHA
jgi:hypothetical protein